MFGFMKSKPKPGEPGVSASTNASPLHSNDGPNTNNPATITPARRTSSEPMLMGPDDDDDDDGYFGRGKPTRNRNKKDLDSMSVQELEGYAVDQAKQTTKSVDNCLKIAEDIKQDAARTLETLHQQGEQINRTHVMAVDMDKDLSKGEKLLNNLGGMFSKPWKPKKTREINGPVTTPDNNAKGKKASYEQREKLGLAPIPKGKNSKTPPPEPTNALEQVELEKAKQDDALSDLSNILGDLKGMAVDMGSELERQNKALDHLSDDVDELNSRVKGANQRARKLLGK
ncbi:OLC1v1032651C1 [Oldenlandia corymbosa var. corymbosa]|uniref:OLC1v1032651C1 n=1 Tax=Oldenlandia corymbosa var. corymbosa TaxID=529605 RepID=A0AAV1CP77_OLDCO|nr:OLC1v1032651C1 [Oldenlandia corymbosa var. corymbosa]